MKPPPNFDHIAGVYRWLERLTFANSLWRCRCTFLDDLLSCRTALVIGDGDGRFTARLLEANPTIRIDAVDNSRAMLHALVRRAGANADRVRTYQADARQWLPPSSPYDLIITHFFLDCLTTGEVAELADRLRESATWSSLWIVSEFATPPDWFGWFIARPLVTALYLSFALLARTRVFHLPRHHEALTQAGFSLRLTRPRASGLLVSEIWAPAPQAASRNSTAQIALNAVLESRSMEQPAAPAATSPQPSR